ncbi:MAG: hypothetical protein IPJ89_02055 [Candidatus Iainarchaeum archaeon]|uniref:Uncharacterized protein n=1 Tax=Candidatus Iainarchaeum sp. TaxID=3101447 RepID=A0A7T9I2G0_9ARCH|nr:MAG: hypothetical protein IPJ89_02055 [Candidatus Diapherotrites archaeon]
MPALFRHPVFPGTYIIFEPNGTRTYVWDSNSHGMVVEQRLPTGEKRRIRYGNDQAGYELYIQILRFLAATKQRIPGFPLKGERENSALKSSIQTKIDAVMQQKGVQPHQMDMNSHGTILPVQLPNNQQGLAFSQDEQPPIFLSKTLIEGLAKAIPLIYRENPYFHQVHAFFTNKANRRKARMQFIPLPKEISAPWMHTRRKPNSKIGAQRMMSVWRRRLAKKRKR